MALSNRMNTSLQQIACLEFC